MLQFRARARNYLAGFAAILSVSCASTNSEPVPGNASANLSEDTEVQNVQAPQQASTPGANPNVLINSAARGGLSLNGQWNYSIDPYEDGLFGFHGSPTQLGSGRARFDPVNVDEHTRKHPRALFEYDMRQSASADLPASWVGHSPELRLYEGLMWYARDFESSDIEAGNRVFLRFGAANYRSLVYLNGVKIGEHVGGFTPFSFEISGMIQEGSNTITVGVDSKRSETAVPPPVTDWETYGGITRPVKLIAVPDTFIDDAWIRLSTRDSITSTVELDGPDAAGTTVQVNIPELNLSWAGTTDADGVWTASIDAPKNLTLWSPDAPKLYDVEVTTGTDRITDRIGFRTVQISGEDILLNGEPIFLKGVSVHEEEIGPNPVRNMTYAAAIELLSIVKNELNGNFVRLAHYPHSESMIRAADELGIMVWSEIPVYWRIDWENEDTLQTAREMQAANIRRDRNRASIVLWSIANETPLGDARFRFLSLLTDDVRALDDTRLVTAAMLTSIEEENGQLTTRISDPLAEILDVLAVNTYHGWYGNIPLEDVSEIRWSSDHNKPLIFSEFGAGARYGFHDPDLKRKFSEEYQAEYYRETLEMADKVRFLRGMSPWVLKDFRSPRRQHPIYQQGWNRKGLIAETGEKKQAFYTLSAHYREK